MMRSGAGIVRVARPEHLLPKPKAKKVSGPAENKARKGPKK